MCKPYNNSFITFIPLNKGIYRKQVLEEKKFDLFKIPANSLCQKYDRSPTEIILNWHLLSKIVTHNFYEYL